MYKKGVIFLVFLILLSGCTHNGDSSVQEDQFAEFSNQFPFYYTDYNEANLEIIKKAMFSNDDTICEDIFNGLKTDEERLTKVKEFLNCKILFKKFLAFHEKNTELCKELYGGDRALLDLEECNAPILAYRAVQENDVSLCKKYLTTERLINLCEDDYENYK
jgi:hypothetical protein